MKNGKFALPLGVEQKTSIESIKEIEKITSDFLAEPISNYAYIIIGPKESEKTILLSNVANYLAKSDGWIVANSNQNGQILETVASEIYKKAVAKKWFSKRDFSFSFQGVYFSLKGKEPTTTVISLIKKMVGSLNKRGKRVLIVIDEVDNTPEMKKFIQAYESLIRQNYKILLLMSGQHENVSKLQDSPTLTFLYRAPKIPLGPS